MVDELSAEVVIEIEQVICLAIFFEDLFPGVEGFPDTGAFSQAVGDVKGDVIDLAFQLCIFHYYYILAVLAGQVVDVVAKIGETAMPAWIVR